MTSRKMEDYHRIVLQSLMSHGILNHKEVKKLYKSTMARYEVPEEECSLSDIMNTIIANIKCFQFEIRKALSEEDGSQHYVFVNTNDSELTKQTSSNYAPHEYDYFKRLVQLIVESDNGSVSAIAALNLVNTKKMTKSNAEALIDRLDLEKWIISSEGNIWLNTRSLVELDVYIRETFPNLVVFCEVCKKICLKGQTCEKCDVKMHAHCAGQLFSNRDQPKCPGHRCNAAWNHPITRRKRAQDVSERQETPSPTKRKK